MTTVQDILTYLHTIAPVSMKMDWDNEGLLCGDPAQEVNKILVALDPFEHVCKEAGAVQADLILTHHPLIFEAPKAITPETSVGRCIRFLCQNGISAINAHTNLDCAPGGVNDTLAELLQLNNIQVIEPSGVDDAGTPWGLLRMGNHEAQLPDFLAFVKQQLGTPVLRYVSSGQPVRRVAVGGGACAGALYEVWKAGCDTFVTADVKYNQFWDAKEMGINLIDAGHFYTENPVCARLAEKLRAQFPAVVVEISKIHADCMEFA